jgi:hypothetical protein
MDLWLCGGEGEMKLGDIVMFTWPSLWSKVDDPPDWEKARIGLVIEISAHRPGDKYGDELVVLHEGERWSVPTSWCHPIKERG